MVVLFQLLERDIHSVAARLFILALYAAIPLHLAEILNGMEMHLLAFLFCLLLWAERLRSKLIFLLIPLILLTRFEAAFYLGVVFFGLTLFDRDRRMAHVGRMVFVVAVFAVFTAARFVYFSDIMPNTVWAKMHYGTESGGFLDFVKGRIEGPAQLARVMAPLLLASLVLLLLRPDTSILRRTPFWLLVGYTLFAAVTGTNSGYSGRMFTGLLPGLLILLAGQASAHRPAARLGVMISVLLALTIAANTALLRQNALRIAWGGTERGILPQSVSIALGDRISASRFGAVPTAYRRNGLIADRVREVLGEDTITLLAPDIGGLGLCCDPTAIRVVDLALLANQELSHKGYDAFPDQFAREAPDLILAHWLWADWSRLYETEAFLRDYRPVILIDTLFWVREDRRQELEALAPRLVPDFRTDQVVNDFREIDNAFFAETNPYPIYRIGPEELDLDL